MSRWFSTKPSPTEALRESKMNQYEFYIAIAVLFLISSVMFYIEAKNTIEPSWKQVVRFGLNPIVLVFFALTPLVLWWTYRVIYQFTEEQFWYATIIHTFIFQVAYIGASYLATRQIPSPRNWFSLGLGIVAVVISAR